MGRKHYYNDDPGLADVPLSVDEASALVAEPRAVGKGDLPHLLRRVAATARRCETVRRNYDDELRRRTAAMPRPGLPATLSPEEAVKFLNQEQLVRLFDRFSQEKLHALEQLRDRAAADHQATTTAARRLVDVVTVLLADDLVPQERSRLEASLQELHHILGTDLG